MTDDHEHSRYSEDEMEYDYYIPSEMEEPKSDSWKDYEFEQTEQVNS